MGHFRINGISRRITLTLLCGMLILMLVLGVYMLNVISHTNQESRTYALSMTDNMTDLISNKASAIARVSSLLAQNNYVEDYFDSTNVAQRGEHQGVQQPGFHRHWGKHGRTKKGVCIDVEVFVNCKFGYDINCEVVCEDGALKMAQPAYPSIRKNAAVSSAIDTDCFVRFKDAYDKEVQDWVDNAEAGVITGPNAWDGYLAAITADALVKAQETGQIEKIVTAVEKPEFYK